MSERTLLAGIFGFSVLFLLPAYLVELVWVGAFEVTLPLLLSLLYVGALSSAVAYLAWNRAVTLIGPPRAGVVYYLLPVLTALLATWLLGEPVTGVQGLSMVLIVTGVALGLRGSRSTAEHPRSESTLECEVSKR